MSVEPPYPGGHAPLNEPVVTYTMRDVIDQINAKLDMITTSFGTRMSDIELRLAAMENRPAPIRDGELRMTQVETKVDKAETRVDGLEKVQDRMAAASLFKDRAFAKLLGVATVIGGAAGVVLGLIQALT